MEAVPAKEENHIFDFVSIGEILVDLTKTYNVTYDRPIFLQNAGGAPANVACALAKFGLNTAFCGMAGDDSFGRFCMDVLRDNGVSTEYLFLSQQHPTTLSIVDLNSNGDRSFSFYRDGTADVNLSINDVRQIRYDEIKNFHFGTLSFTAETSKNAVLEAVRLARKSGSNISCDVNLRPSLWPSNEIMKSEVCKILETVPIDILKLSEEELATLTSESELEKGIEIITNSYPCQLVFITRGNKGAVARYHGRNYFSRAYRVNALDTTGAGDFFFAAALYYIITNSISNDDLSDSDIDCMMNFANATAALSTLKHGAIPSIPSLDAIIGMQIAKI